MQQCFKEFPRASFGDKPDFSGFDRESWEPRASEDHQAAAEKVRHAETPSDAQKFASSSGASYSVLFQLPYYDAIRFALIDPMHNLLLGSAKHVLKTWIEMGILSESDLERVQKRVNLVKPPSEIGRIPSKISEGFKRFTADQWKNWVCIYSFFALKGVIPSGYYGIWIAFVHACQLLCRKVITKECMEAEHKLMRFCVMLRSLLWEGEVHTKHASSWVAIFKIAYLIMDLFSLFGASHLRGTMELWEITIQIMLTSVGIKLFSNK